MFSFNPLYLKFMFSNFLLKKILNFSILRLTRYMNAYLNNMNINRLIRHK